MFPRENVCKGSYKDFKHSQYKFNVRKKMLTLSSRNNLGTNIVAPLQFTLVTSKEDAYEAILKLRAKAKGIFPKVSKIFRLYDEECLPSAINDTLLDVKLLGQELFLYGDSIITVNPENIVGFGVLLPTNRVAYFAFASYPTAIKIANKNIIVPSNRNAFWNGIIETFAVKCDECGDEERFCKKCVSAHQLSCKFLDFADNMGILEEVKDSTGFWINRNSQSLVDICVEPKFSHFSETA